ncbi:unnamed protein product [Darwinula stevensoni]|uniref:Uncharacterized protein n=1 Tax=Darwinula stevensoni TaxID=69355 RepID=A0A7R9AIE3_9CRUS|nr:unnamed protein product [Darwinula stevensoni]CAG0906849.1 unnamed protein product [Darwinula stevensoni]
MTDFRRRSGREIREGADGDGGDAALEARGRRGERRLHQPAVGVPRLAGQRRLRRLLLADQHHPRDARAREADCGLRHLPEAGQPDEPGTRGQEAPAAAPQRLPHRRERVAVGPPPPTPQVLQSEPRQRRTPSRHLLLPTRHHHRRGGGGREGQGARERRRKGRSQDELRG